MCILFMIRLEILTKHINKLLAKKWTDLFSPFFLCNLDQKGGNSMNVKAMKEKLNAQIEQLAEAKINGLETRAIEEQIEELRGEIKTYQEEIRKNTVTISTDTEGNEINEMKTKTDLNLELREATKEKGIQNVGDLEYRANVVTSTAVGVNTQHTVPVDFLGGVLFEAQHDNFLLSMVDVLRTENETQITVADYTGPMKDLKEMEEIADSDFITSEKSIQLSRKGCATTVSQHLMQSANFNVQQHVAKIFGQSLAVTCEKLIAKALKDEVEIEAVTYEGSALKAIVQSLAVMPESLRRSACIIVSPETYANILGEEDSVGRNLLDFNYQNSLRAKIAGVPLVISAEIGDEIYVGSLKDAVKIGYSPRSLEAERAPRKDAISFFLNVYMGSCVVLPGAVKRLKKQH